MEKLSTSEKNIPFDEFLRKINLLYYGMFIKKSAPICYLFLFSGYGKVEELLKASK